MKNLEKNRNIYVQHGRFYIDYQKNGVRIRRSTGIKKSSFAFDFIRKITIFLLAHNLILKKLGVNTMSLRIYTLIKF